MEFCPNCGNEVNELDDETGFCAECTPNPRELYSRVEQYLAANAEELEFYIYHGKSLYQAIDLLHDGNHRPKCLCCGAVIKRAKRTAVFCRQNKECRRYSRKYVYLYTERGLSKSQALAVIMEELT
jgi:hypothetical protein